MPFVHMHNLVRLYLSRHDGFHASIHQRTAMTDTNAAHLDVVHVGLHDPEAVLLDELLHQLDALVVRRHLLGTHAVNAESMYTDHVLVMMANRGLLMMASHNRR